MSSISFYKKYNGQNWIIRISLFNFKQNITTILVTQNISQMSLYNDIECFCPTFELSYLDLSLSLAKILDNNNLQLYVEIQQPPPNQLDPLWNKADLLNLNLLFNIDKVSTVFKQNNMIMYKFNATLNLQSLLLQNTNYATIKDLKDTANTKESPLVLINKLLTKINYPVDQIVNDTTQRINFISSQTMSVKDSIDYLLRRAVSPEDPPTYFVHNLKSGKAMLINNKKIEERLFNPVNDLNVYGARDSKPLNFDLLSQVTNITNHSFCAGILSERFLSKFHFRHFDQNTRKWSVTTFDYNKINSLFNSYMLNQNKEYSSVFAIKQKVDNAKMQYDFPVDNEQKMYLFLRELQLGTNSIQFDVAGIITRDAGQYVYLNCINESQMARYQGLWHIYSCKHIWSGVSYTNNIVGYRTFTWNPIWNPKLQNERTSL